MDSAAGGDLWQIVLARRDVDLAGLDLEHVLRPAIFTPQYTQLLGLVSSETP